MGVRQDVEMTNMKWRLSLHNVTKINFDGWHNPMTISVGIKLLISYSQRRQFNLTGDAIMMNWRLFWWSRQFILQVSWGSVRWFLKEIANFKWQLLTPLMCLGLFGMLGIRWMKPKWWLYSFFLQNFISHIYIVLGCPWVSFVRSKLFIWMEDIPSPWPFL